MQTTSALKQVVLSSERVEPMLDMTGEPAPTYKLKLDRDALDRAWEWLRDNADLITGEVYNVPFKAHVERDDLAPEGFDAILVIEYEGNSVAVYRCDEDHVRIWLDRPSREMFAWREQHNDGKPSECDMIIVALAVRRLFEMIAERFLRA